MNEAAIMGLLERRRGIREEMKFYTGKISTLQKQIHEIDKQVEELLDESYGASA